MSLNFRKGRPEEPEINLIPFIDVLLVILIFLMLSTTYSKFTELQVTLPIADAEKARDRPNEIIVSVAGDGRYAVNRKPVDDEAHQMRHEPIGRLLHVKRVGVDQAAEIAIEHQRRDRDHQTERGVVQRHRDAVRE